jgi:hypothetical protein
VSRRRLIADALAGVLAASVAFAAGRAAFSASPSQPFSQAEFGPAVMIAIGQGFVSPEVTAGGALERFLLMQVDAIEADAVGTPRASQPDQFQNMHRYLLILIGNWWRFAGISWQRLAEIAGLMHALSAIATFMLLRLFVPTAAAVTGALWLAVSPLQLLYAPQLRDFVKGPFVIAAIPATVALVLRASSWRALAACAALTGVVIGVGIGFRMDVAIMAPIAVASVILFRGRRPWSGLGDKAWATGILILALVVSSWPVVSRLSSGGSNSFHVVLLGYSDGFDTRLGIAPAAYSYLPFYSDSYLNNVLRARAMAATGADAPMPSRAYDAAGFALWRQWLRHFPADAYTRLLAAADGVLNLAFDNPLPEVAGRWPLTMALGGVFEWLNSWRGWGWLLGAGLIGLAAYTGAGRALFAALMLLALAGYPSLQFDPRHYYHLQVIPIAIMVTTAVAAWRAAAAWRQPPAMTGAPAVARARHPLVIAAVVMVAVTVVPVASLRAYQARHLTGVVSAFVAAAREPLDVEWVPLAENRWLAQWPGVHGADTGVTGLRAAYLVAEFRAEAGPAAMAIGLRYAGAPDWAPCALTRQLVTAGGVARFAFPAYSLDGDSVFEGLEMGPQMRARLIGLYRTGSGPANLPIEVRLAGDWSRRRLFQRFTSEERLSADDTGVGLFAAADHCGSQLPYVDATLDQAAAVGRSLTATLVSPNAAIGPAGLTFDGSASDAAPELARFAPIELAAGDAVIARIMVERGSATIGLSREGAPVQQVAVPRPGLSIVVLPVTEAGRFTPVVGSAAPGWRAGLRFTIDRLAVRHGDGRVSAIHE